MPTPSQEIRITVFLPLEAFYTGISQQTISFNRTSFCSFCNATGVDSPQFDRVGWIHASIN